MSKRFIPVALLTGLTLVTGVAFATGPAYPTNPERNDIVQSVVVAKSRAQVKNELAEFLSNAVTADGWRYVGGEREWALIQHQFAFSAGNVIHVDRLAHNVPKVNRQLSRAEQAESRVLYKNAP